MLKQANLEQKSIEVAALLLTAPRKLVATSNKPVDNNQHHFLTAISEC